MNILIDKIICGNCLDVMKNMPDNSIDLVLTDPPYGLEIEYDSFVDTQENLKNLIDSFMPEVLRIGKLVAIFPGIHNVWLYPKADWIACWFYGTTGSWGKFGYNSWQPILLYGENNKRYGMDTIKYSKIAKREPGHPCSKPLGLMKMVLARFSEEGHTVLDPFMGSGSTIIAAKILKRKFVGIEISPEYCKIAETRIKALPVSLF